MLGFCAVMFMMASLIAVGSYWISWEMQDARSRSGFGAKACSDFAQLFARKPSGAEAQAESVPSSGG